MTTKELERLVHEYKGNDVSDDENNSLNSQRRCSMLYPN